MRALSETETVGLVAGIIATLAIAAVILLSVREKRRTGRYPSELFARDNRSAGWFNWVWLGWLFVLRGGSVTKYYQDITPVMIIALGVDLALMIGFLAFVGFTFSHVFKQEWNKQTAYWIAWSMLFPSIFLFLTWGDWQMVSTSWWKLAPIGIVGIFFGPFCARWTYEEYHLRRLREYTDSSQSAPRIYRPGDQF